MKSTTIIALLATTTLIIVGVAFHVGKNQKDTLELSATVQSVPNSNDTTKNKEDKEEMVSTWTCQRANFDAGTDTFTKAGAPYQEDKDISGVFNNAKQGIKWEITCEKDN